MKIPKMIPISDFRLHQADILSDVETEPLLVLSKNKPVGVFVSVSQWEEIQKLIDIHGGDHEPESNPKNK